ncbi:uncharacterized protein PAC_09590 [Phialocephala subalpina]|uniref:Uncharacterized protein n=1 Tax=Phialocephala subalpina TaxID=576137 RepID=A0A1L7X3U6_9HELO|nr:uncharacterized protein PAC_09590 [Phialocephala subalpina]
MNRPVENKVPPPQYRKIQQQNASTVSVQLGSTTSDHTYRKKTTTLQKVGVWNAAIIMIGSLCILGVLGFLWYLWTADERNEFWRWLVRKEYLQRTVTLSSAVLRTVVTFQSGICTSMIAGSIMELSSFEFTRTASLSIRRFNGGLPTYLFQSGVFSRQAWYLFIVTVLLSTTTIASYFLSTGLIADLGIAPIFGDVVAGQATYSLNFTKTTTIRLFEPDFTSYMPSTFPTFAEYSEPTNSTPGVDDSGLTVRAILPFSSATTRQTMSNYTGPGTVLNTHVVCIKPELRNFSFISGGGHSQIDPVYVRGMVSVGSVTPSGLIFANTTQPATANISNFIGFTCFLEQLAFTGEWPITMCIAGNGFADVNITGEDAEGTRLPIQGTKATSLLNEGLINDPLSYILVNYTGTLPNSHGLQQYTNWTDISAKDSSWAVLRNDNSFDSLIDSISLTYCFTNFGAIDTNVTAHSPTNRTEPVLLGLPTGTILEASQVISQLGADGSNSSLAERGILSLEYSRNWTGIFPDDQYDTAFNSSWVQVLDGTYGFGMTTATNVIAPVNNSWAWCTACGRTLEKGDVNPVLPVSAALSSIFQSSIQQSGSAAKALQAALTVVNMMQYYSRMNQFDIVGPSNTTLIEQQLQPVERSGLIATTGGLVLHLLVVAAICLIFLIGTNLSFIGESWHTIAQLQSRDIVTVLQGVDMMRDNEVDSWLREREVSLERMTLVGEDENDQVAHVVRRRGGVPVGMI